MRHNNPPATAQPAIDSIEGFVGYQLRRASALFGADFNIAVEGSGMRQVLVGILSVIAAEPGIHQGEVGRRLGIQRANMVALINELVERALVVRDVGDDRRAFALRATAEGLALLADCMARIRAGEEALLDSFSPGERDLLMGLLRRLNRAG
ncbi:MarR family winged helix-turn-helix transcriptional regulator [Sphingomonas sp. 28-63-12]|uniref:MarR family winged helix-turn-helix transcriptional regulator n=1 Tax=Sphingomonas sp. 28-63-12 TaxID=1970434 RepID=UPI000BDB6FD2|nr:MAG: hypothetical protein B7Y47_09725 [Sphingomonas sp. 28-63-12]